MKISVLRKFRFWNADERYVWADKLNKNGEIAAPIDELDSDLASCLGPVDLSVQLRTKLLLLHGKNRSQAATFFRPSVYANAISSIVVFASATIGIFIGANVSNFSHPEDEILMSIASEFARAVWSVAGG